MFWIVFEPKVWYYHQFFIVSLEIKPMMFLHLLRSFGSKPVKLPHVLTFLFNFYIGWTTILSWIIVLFFHQFLHIFDANLPTTPSVKWKFAVVSWLLGSHLHLKYGTSHAENKKTWFSSQRCTNQRQKAWLYPQESDKRWAKEMCTTWQGSRTRLHPFEAMEQRSAPNQHMQATCVHTEKSDRIASSSCIVLGKSQIRLCPVKSCG